MLELKLNHVIKRGHWTLEPLQVHRTHAISPPYDNDVSRSVRIRKEPTYCSPNQCYTMMTSSNGKIFRVTVAGEFPSKGKWRGALMISLICAWINGWVNKREAGDLRRYLAHHDVTVMQCCFASWHLHGAWNRNALRINGPLWGNPPVTDGLPPKLSVMRIFGIVSDVSLNKLLNLRP